MLVRISIITGLFLMTFSGVKAQVYDSDSLRIEIKYKARSSPKEPKDLDIDIVYSNKSKTRPVLVYKSLVSSYRSTFGNCFYELYKYDPVFKGYKNITLDLMGSNHPPMEFKNEEEILQYDPERSLLKPGEKRTLTFNLLNFVSAVVKGQYSMKVYIRTGNKFGYDAKGHIIANSIGYIETPMMNFEVVEDIDTPNKIKL